MRKLRCSVFLLLLFGCGVSPSTAGPARIITEGKLLVTVGKPASGAILLFHRIGTSPGELPPRAYVNADGAFTVKSVDGDGLPEGEYRVTVDWRTQGENGEEGRSLVSDKYTRLTSTPLKAIVKAGTDGKCTLPTYTLTN
jgi:hypothetical protein